MAKKQTTTRTKPSDTEPTFEEAVEQLEAIIDKIESGEIGLEESIEHYERGVALFKRCRAILDQAEQRIEELTPDDGEADAGD